MNIFSAIPMILDALNDLRLQYLTLSLIVAIAFYLTRRKRATWISLAVFMVNAVAIAPWYFPRINPLHNPNGSPFRLLAINVLNQNRDYDRVITWVRDQQPDLVVFSEVIADWNPWSDALTVLHDDWPYHFRQDKMEIEVYSRWPIAPLKQQAYGEDQPDLPIIRGFIAPEVSVNGQDVVAIATH